MGQTTADNKKEGEIVRVVTATMSKMIYQKGLFKIFLCKFSKHKKIEMVGKEFVCKGTVPFDIFIGDEIEITGNPIKVFNDYTNREEWQIKIKSVKKTEEGDKLQATRILTKINGIGRVKAKSIIDKLGSKALVRIVNSPSVLNFFDFLTADQRLEIYKKVKKLIEKDVVTAELMKLKVTDFQIGRIKEYFTGNVSIPHIKAHVFELTNVAGFGFLTVCRIANAFGIPKTDKGRIKAGLIYSIKELTSNGDCYVEDDALIEKAYKILEIPKNNKIVKEVFHKMIKDGEIYTFETEVYGESSILPEPKKIVFKEKNDV